MANLSISKAWDETRAIIARDGKLLATVIAALFLLPQVLVSLAAGETSSESPGAGWGLLVLIASIIGLAGQIAIVRLSLRQGTSVGEAIGHGFRRLPIFLLAVLLIVLAAVLLVMVLAGILAAVGAIDLTVNPPNPRDVALVMALLIVPLIFLAVRLVPLGAVVSEEPVGIVGSLRRCWQLTSGNGWRLLGFVVAFIIGALVVTLAITMIGAMIVRLLFGVAEPFSIGALVLGLFAGIAQAAVTLVYVVMMARIYAQLAGPANREVEEVFR